MKDMINNPLIYKKIISQSKIKLNKSYTVCLYFYLYILLKLFFYFDFFSSQTGGDELQAHDEANDRSDQNGSNGAPSVQIRDVTFNGTLLTTLLLIFTSKLIIS